MRPSSTMLMIGDDLLGACFDDSQADIPIRTIGGDAQLEHRVALACVKSMLHREHFGPTSRERLMKKPGAPDKIIDHRIKPVDDWRRYPFGVFSYGHGGFPIKLL